MQNFSELEARREKNILRNRLILLKLGLLEQNSPRKQKLPNKLVKEDSAKVSWGSISKTPNSSAKKRFSARLHRNVTDVLSDNSVNDDEDGSDVGLETHTASTKKIKRPNVYGAIEGVEVGESWLTRLECSNAGVHRPTVAGIHAGHDGAYSIALSGGYDDDIDYGETFTYTGAGGRDLKGTKMNPKNLRTAPQTKDQTLDNFNRSLVTSVETKNPVRVIRGYKLDSPYAPEEGYRYDGLYTVEKFWTATGTSGFLVYKFSLKRCDGQAPPPWMETALTSNHNTSSHLHHTSSISRNGTSQATESSGSVESRRRTVKSHSWPNHSASVLDTVGFNEEENVNSIVNKDFNISKENSNTASNCIHDENSTQKMRNLTNTYNQISAKSDMVNSCGSSLIEKKDLKYSERTSLTPRSPVSSLTKMTRRSPNQKRGVSKNHSNSEQKLFNKIESKISEIINKLKKNSYSQDNNVELNGKKFSENSTSCLPEIDNCNVLKKSSPFSNVCSPDTKRCKYSEVTSCLNTINTENPVVLVEKMSNEQIDTIIVSESQKMSNEQIDTIIVSESQNDIGESSEKSTPKRKMFVDCSTKFNHSGKSDRHSSKTFTSDSPLQTVSVNKGMSETKSIKKIKAVNGNRSDNSVKKCCVRLFRFDKHSSRNVSIVSENAQKHNMWYGWDIGNTQDFLGFSECDLSKTYSKYFQVCNCHDSLSKYVDEKECTSNEDENSWPGW